MRGRPIDRPGIGVHGATSVLGACPPATPTGLRLHIDHQGWADVVHLRGRLGVVGLSAIESALAELLTDVGHTVVCVLQSLDYLSPRAVSMLKRLRESHPPQSLVLCGASGQVLRMLRTLDPWHVLPVFRAVAEARDAVPPLRRGVFAFPPAPEAARLARAFGDRICAQWSPALPMDTIRLLISGLVTNALLHSRTDGELILTFDDRTLMIAVVDDAPSEPRTSPARLSDARSRKLFLVRALADRIGSFPRPNGGTVVWCTLTPTPLAKSRRVDIAV